MGIHFVSNEMMEMRYQCKEGFVEESGRTNVVIAGLYHSSSPFEVVQLFGTIFRAK
jgi:hypothetical protein